VDQARQGRIEEAMSLDLSGFSETILRRSIRLYREWVANPHTENEKKMLENLIPQYEAELEKRTSDQLTGS
jgi:hypothetical protein